MFPSTSNRYQDFGNFHYGAVAFAFGLDLETALRMAGWAQTASKTGKKDLAELERIAKGTSTLPPPYGDDWRDQNRIKRGYQWARDHFKPR